MDKKHDWQKKLPEEVYYICWMNGTEPPFTGRYNKHSESGSYVCVCCGNPLFSSKTKYDSKSGWPSFYDAILPDSVQVCQDKSYGMIRNEVKCAKCHAHLGHVFNDGPEPTGKRYCINSLALNFIKDNL